MEKIKLQPVSRHWSKSILTSFIVNEISKIPKTKENKENKENNLFFDECKDIPQEVWDKLK